MLTYLTYYTTRMLMCMVSLWIWGMKHPNCRLVYRICPKTAKPALTSLQKQEAEYIFCCVQVLHMYKDRTAVVRKLEQLFRFRTTSDFAISFMKQQLPHHVGISFWTISEEISHSSTHSIYPKFLFVHCLPQIWAWLSFHTSFCVLWLLMVQIKHVDSMIRNNWMNTKWI